MVLINVTCLKANSRFPTPIFQMKTFLISSSCQQIAPLLVIFGYSLFLHAHTWYTGRSFWFYLQRIFKYAYFISFTTTLVQASVFCLAFSRQLQHFGVLTSVLAPPSWLRKLAFGLIKRLGSSSRLDSSPRDRRGLLNYFTQNYSKVWADGKIFRGSTRASEEGRLGSWPWWEEERFRW